MTSGFQILERFLKHPFQVMGSVPGARAPRWTSQCHPCSPGALSLVRKTEFKKQAQWSEGESHRMMGVQATQGKLLLRSLTFNTISLRGEKCLCPMMFPWCFNRPLHRWKAQTTTSTCVRVPSRPACLVINSKGTPLVTYSIICPLPPHPR